MMYLRYTSYLILWVACVVLGTIMYFPARYLCIGDSVWGNDTDGYCGDASYKATQAKVWYRKPWPCYWWSVFRNPVQNLCRRTLAAKGIIESIERRGNLTLATIGGKRYFFYYNEGDKYLVKFGWKLWNNKAFEVGKRVAASFVFNP